MADVIVSFTINAHCYEAVMRDVEFHEHQGNIRGLSILPQDPTDMWGLPSLPSPPSPPAFQLPSANPLSLPAILNPSGGSPAAPRHVSPPWITRLPTAGSQPTRKRKRPDHKTLYLDQECTICMSDPLGDEFKILRCGHIFCTGCIRHWYRANGRRTKKCPTCKKPFVRTDVY